MVMVIKIKSQFFNAQGYWPIFWPRIILLYASKPHKPKTRTKLYGNGQNKFAKNLEKVVIEYWFRGEFRPIEKRSSLP